MATAEAAVPWTGGRPLRDALLGELLWRRSGSFGRELILEAGSERLASLRWEKWFSFQAIASCADGGWIISSRRSFSLRGEEVVRDATSEAEVAAFKSRWTGTGVARFASGAEYPMEREGFWRPRYFWADAERKPLITFRPLMGFRRSYEMTVDPAARRLAEIAVLVLLGAYVMAMISARSRSS